MDGLRARFLEVLGRPDEDPPLAVNVLDVETVVIGGGLGTRLGEPYVRRIEAAMSPHLFVSDRPPPGAVGGAAGPERRAVGASLLV